MKTQRSALWKGEVESVVQALEALTPKSEEATEFVRQSIGYFQTNRERMRYDRFRDRGYPIGSGAVEGGGCKCLVGGRGCAGALMGRKLSCLYARLCSATGGPTSGPPRSARPHNSPKIWRAPLPSARLAYSSILCYTCQLVGSIP